MIHNNNKANNKKRKGKQNKKNKKEPIKNNNKALNVMYVPSPLPQKLNCSIISINLDMLKLNDILNVYIIISYDWIIVKKTIAL
jgi:hypothetical protein